MHIAPSLLSADFSRLGEELQWINQSEAHWLHVDVMDGVFVPNISLGFPVIEALKGKCLKPMDVHLMIVQPDPYITRFREAGAEVISVHWEACTHLHRTLQAIRATGAKAGIALNPHTPAASLDAIIDQADVICVMSVNPGFGGQAFIESTYRKVNELVNLREKRGGNALIEIDGGVTLQNAPLLKQAGADVLVAGNTVFRAPQPNEMVSALTRI